MNMYTYLVVFSAEVIFTSEPATSNHMDTFEYEKAMGK